MRTYEGPVSDHSDGARFYDPDGSPPKSLGEVLRWQFGPDRRRQPWPEWAPSPTPIGRRRALPATRCGCRSSVTPAGLIQTSGLNILIDPVWSDRASPFTFAGPKRHNAAGHRIRRAATDRYRVGVARALRSSRRGDAVKTQRRNFSPRVITRSATTRSMHSADSAIRAERSTGTIVLNWASGVAVTLVPTRHWSARGLFAPQQVAMGELVLETPAGKLYIVLRFRLRRRQAFSPRRRNARPAAAGDPPHWRL